MWGPPERSPDVILYHLKTRGRYARYHSPRRRWHFRGFVAFVPRSHLAHDGLLGRQPGHERGCRPAALPDVDHRSTWARRLRDLIALHTSDLGGEDNISQAEKSIVRRAAVLTCELERLEVAFAEAGEPQPALLQVYQTTANSLRRLLESGGLQRRSRDVTPTLAQYLQSKNEASE